MPQLQVTTHNNKKTATDALFLPKACHVDMWQMHMSLPDIACCTVLLLYDLKLVRAQECHWTWEAVVLQMQFLRLSTRSQSHLPGWDRYNTKPPECGCTLLYYSPDPETSRFLLFFFLGTFSNSHFWRDICLETRCNNIKECLDQRMACWLRFVTAIWN